MSIKVDLYLIFSVFILIFFRQAEIFLTFYIFAVFHEFAHVLIALLLKIHLEEISFLPVGVNAKFNFNNHKIKEIIVASAGPLFSLVIAYIMPQYKLPNIFIFLTNIVPIYPLDGGRILKNTILLKLGTESGIKRYQSLLRIFVILLLIFNIIQIIYLKNYSILFSSLYILQMVNEEIKKDKVRSAMKSLFNIEI